MTVRHPTGGARKPKGARSRVPHNAAPRLHWVLMAMMFVAFAGVLAVNGIVKAEFGADHEMAPPTDAHTVPELITSGGPIIDLTGDDAQSYEVPDKTAVITFDDGPDPEWTPEILEVLRSHGVPATFFVVGSQAAQHPELIREIHESESELGVHTFTHPDLGTIPEWRREWELSETQLVLSGAANVTSWLMRPPYSSLSVAIDDTSWPALQDLGRRGYVTVLTTHDTKDWSRPGVDEIVRNGTPEDGEGGVILMHDAGGDRSQTVAALDRLIAELKARGYEFSTVAGIVDASTANPEASAGQSLRGSAFLTVVQIATAAIPVLVILFGIAGLLVITRLFILIALSRRHAKRIRRGMPGVPVTAAASVIVPAYNEAKCIADTVRSIVNSDHPVEVIVVDDGSTDGTADIVERMRLPTVRVIRQPNGGKPAALNTGIAHARNDLIVMMDGDTIFEPTTVRRLIQPFRDPRVGAVAGNTKVRNRNGLLATWQHIEYVIGFNIDRRAYDVLQCMPTVPGAIGALRKQTLADVGGVSDDTLAEDTDLTMAVGRAGWRVVYQPSAVAWTEVPASLDQLWRQRYRWCYGTIQAIWKHRRAVFASGSSGHFGRVGLLHLALYQVILPLIAPLMDAFLVYGLFFLDPTLTLLAWGTLLAAQTIGGIFAFKLDKEPMRVLWLLPLQQIAYRQLMYGVVIQSIVTAVAGARLRWHKLQRVGSPPPAPAPADRVAEARR